ncbi:hypothetical protein G8764_13575 [Pseudomaricurvus alcaniphilus]|uniref:hypothetical protein n=1 Tax=Pseudomaricurvus alcaniphilus TaxID=1166482 RepID=UPI0014099B88|nr:hypothetical protein [Pseudomaricurvus alcaniphilus]NHN38333.1 hypothetical protein [Pseudomaricurvus alcaniphilus]
MHALRIEQLSKRYRIQQQQRQLLPVMDRLLQEVLEDYLPDALGSLGIGEGEELCVRQLQVPLSFQPGKTGTDNGLHWCRQLVLAIEQQLHSGNNVLRFANRRSALLDFAQQVARHNLDHAWAWNQLQLSLLSDTASVPQARQQLLRALLREPELILATLLHLSQQQLLLPLLLGYDAVEVDDLWWGWLDYCGIERHWLRHEAADAPQAGGRPAQQSRQQQYRQDRQQHPQQQHRQLSLQLQLAAQRSVILRELRAQAGAFRAAALSPRHWSLLLAMELAPACLLATADEVAAALGQLQQLLPAIGGGPVEIKQVKGGQAQHADDHQGDRKAAIKPQAGEQGGRAGRGAEPPFGSDADAVHPQDQRQQAPPAAEQQAANDPLDSSAPPLDLAVDDHSPEFSELREWQEQTLNSDCAGLFLLLPLLRHCDLVPALLGDEHLRERPLSWSLYQLCQCWLPVAADDPALKLFCTLSVTDDWPFDPERTPANPQQQQCLQDYAARVRDALAQCLRWELPAEKIVARLCQRPGRLLVQGGWLEVVFALPQVDTDIRRAGLDLDPDFVPWLGKVVKIRYE